MNYIEIILENIQKQYLDIVIKDVLKFREEDIISSHFYDSEHDRDITFQDIGNLVSFFHIAGTGNLFLQKAVFGTELEKVLIVISCDEEFADITIHFCEEPFERYEGLDMRNKIGQLFQAISTAQKYYSMNVAIVGYEPATDDDMKIVEFHYGQIKIYNEKWQSPFAQACYDVLRSIPVIQK